MRPTTTALEQLQPGELQLSLFVLQRHLSFNVCDIKVKRTQPKQSRQCGCGWHALYFSLLKWFSRELGDDPVDKALEFRPAEHM